MRTGRELAETRHDAGAEPSPIVMESAVLAMLRSAWLQSAGVAAAWGYVALLHLGNDGLWYSGDSARHAANGLFWWDFLTTLPAHPTEYALRYFARYPVINPTSYPPLFYLLEGMAYRLFGVSPFVAKWLVLSFALFGGLYLTAWLRRWVSAEAGWVGVLMVLQPGMIRWSNCILLNVPSMALGLAALYHARSWLEQPSPRRLYPALALIAAAVLTYYPAGVVLPVALVWLLAERHGSVFSTPRALRVIVPALCLLGLIGFGASRWAPLHFSLALGGILSPAQLLLWTFYPRILPRVLSVPVLALLPLALLAVATREGQRVQRRFAVTWTVVCYLVLSLVKAREPRYALLLVPPLLIVLSGGLQSVAMTLAARVGGTASRWMLLLTGLLIVLHVVLAPMVRVPAIQGFAAAADFFARETPDEPVFYDGPNDGAFAYYMRAGDPELRRGVVRGSKLLYASAIFTTWRLVERATTEAQVVDLLRNESGCHWVVVERRVAPEPVAASNLLRRAVAGPEFERVRSFSVVSPGTRFLDVYRLRGEVRPREKMELLFPVLGPDTVFRAAPLTR